ncbi:hypothetical protein BASA60_001894 [Batrachochytrium salamandrivorans]|nr:hypothetical protein BASA60_009617 [Batrachochytrium salamandrivorans]KAH6582530.1 hypothetical protein BASA60_001894 [Batrachochytrium salamandrivorans]
MKLISFAVVSLLAITVSAYPGPGTPPQDIGAPSEEQHQDVDSQEPLQHQSTDAQEPQQSYDDDVPGSTARSGKGIGR